jgi:hypothetical protein
MITGLQQPFAKLYGPMRRQPIVGRRDLRKELVIGHRLGGAVYNDCITMLSTADAICTNDSAYTVLSSRNGSMTSSSSGILRSLPRSAAAKGIAAFRRSAGGPGGRAAGSTQCRRRANSRSVNVRRTAAGHSSTTSPRWARVIVRTRSASLSICSESRRASNGCGS